MQQDTQPCAICGSKIIMKCFDIHSKACAKKMQKSSLKISSVKSNPLDLIPCAECGQMIDFSVFSFHMEECVGRQLTKCHKCKVLYPTFLFEEHLNICTEFREQEMEEIYGSDQEDNDLGEMIMHLANNLSVHNQQPLDINQINKIKKYVLNQSEQCSICYCEITKNNTIIKLNCPHKFHMRCLTAWLQKNPHCPMCRRHALN